MLTVASALLGFSAPPGSEVSDHWAVIIAGSSGYGNYRHQADVCHAYQLLTTAGNIPADHVITLAVDDVANDSMNPFPGQLFNAPTADGTPGKDVYKGCVIDYKGSMVTPDTFTKVLTGDSEGLNGGKVLKSGPNSRVFVNFVDHGGVNIIGFPRTTMHAKELLAALTKMHEKQMYKDLVFYLEACESGSMFAELPSNLNIYATTAANGHESSWGTYCMPEDKVDGKHIGSCLGDLYSVNWMADAEKVNGGHSLERLQVQYENVKAATTKSHVLQFGTLSLTTLPTRAFEANGYLDTVEAAKVADAPAPRSNATSLRSFDATLESAYRRAAANHAGAADELHSILTARSLAKRRFDAIAQRVAGVAADALPSHEGHDVYCHYTAHTALRATCGDYHPETLYHSADLASLCKFTKGDSKRIVDAILSEC